MDNVTSLPALKCERTCLLDLWHRPHVEVHYLATYVTLEIRQHSTTIRVLRNMVFLIELPI